MSGNIKDTQCLGRMRKLCENITYSLNFCLWFTKQWHLFDGSENKKVGVFATSIQAFSLQLYDWKCSC